MCGGRIILGGLLAAAMLLAAGCGSRDYELHVRLPAGTVVRAEAKVFLDGAEVGKVARVAQHEGCVVATVVLPDRKLAESRIKPGLIATVRSDRGIDLDASEINRAASALPSGSTVEGTTKFDLLIRRYARWQTVGVVAVGVLGLLLVFWVFKLFCRVGWVVVALLLAAGVASALQRPATALVEQVYSGDEGQTTSAPDGKSILDVPKPSPRAVAFVGTWLVSFVLLQMTVGAALRATRKKR